MWNASRVNIETNIIVDLTASISCTDVYKFEDEAISINVGVCSKKSTVKTNLSLDTATNCRSTFQWISHKSKRYYKVPGLNISTNPEMEGTYLNKGRWWPDPVRRLHLAIQVHYYSGFEHCSRQEFFFGVSICVLCLVQWSMNGCVSLENELVLSAHLLSTWWNLRIFPA